MGCDGGTIPRRDELVRQKKKPEQKDKNAETVAKWKHCAITQDPLRKPIVACELGRLYNKEAVIEHILSKGKSSQNAEHISKMSDVKELKLTEKPDFKGNKDQKGDVYVDFHDSRYICPVTSIEMNGKQRFYLIWKCGCVISERAIKEVKSETCHKCGIPVNESDMIILNGSDDEIESLREKMTERRRLAKLQKKKKRTVEADATVSSAKKVKEVQEEGTSSTFKVPLPINGHIGTEPTKLNGQQSGKSSTPPVAVAGCSKQKDSKSTKNLILPVKAQKNYSIAKDPTASAAYKSLFTSHTSAQNQEKAHWVTHNPLYY